MTHKARHQWELRERLENEEGRRRETEEQPLFLPTPSFTASVEEE
jgi:hypothetical protein